MLKQISIILTLTTLALPAFSDTEANEMDQVVTTTDTIEVESTFDARRAFGVQAGLSSSSIKFKDNDDGETTDVDSTGFNIGVSKSFAIGSKVSTATVVSFNYGKLDEKDLDTDNDDIKHTTQDIEVAQKFAFNIETGIGIIVPFVQVGLAYGSWKVKSNYLEEYNSESTAYNWDLSQKYFRQNVSTGVQFILANQIAPFIKLEFSNVSLNDKWTGKASATTNGTTQTKNIDDPTDYSLDMTSQTLTAGVSYLF